MFAPYREASKAQISALQNEKYDEIITNLEKSLEAKMNTEASPIDTFLKFSSKILPNKKSYAQELVKQMEEDLKKKEAEKLERLKPAIAEDFHGYPNRPQTPPKIRREREKNVMNQVKIALENQIFYKNSQRKNSKNQEIENEKSKNLEILKKIEEDVVAKQNKKKLEQEILTNSWQKAQKTKELKSQIESIEKGFNPRSKSIISREEPVVLNQSEYKSDSLGTLLADSPKKVDYKQRAAQIKEEINIRHQKSYQYKIKQLLNDAKSNRCINSKSLSPSYFGTKSRTRVKSKAFNHKTRDNL